MYIKELVFKSKKIWFVNENEVKVKENEIINYYICMVGENGYSTKYIKENEYTKLKVIELSYNSILFKMVMSRNKYERILAINLIKDINI